MVLLVALLPLAYGDDPDEPKGWFILRWVEKTNPRGPSSESTPVETTSFSRVLAFEEADGVDAFTKLQPQLREGDLIAYHLEKGDARRAILKGQLNKVGYRLLKYGHLAIVVEDPEQPGQLRLFSSQSFKGPNTDEAIETLATHSWHAYRLDKWDRLDTDRFHEFVREASARSGNWRGYDFSGMFGLWNSNLQPTSPEEIGHDYICSTVVAAALHYAGVELDAVQRGGLADLVSPQQVVGSKGRLVPAGEIELVAETGQ